MSDGVGQPEGGVVCVECGRDLPADETVVLAGRRVCAVCKPVFLQRLREGADLGGKLAYAGFWARALGAILDGVLLFGVNAVIQLAVSSAVTTAGESPAQALGAVGLSSLLQMAVAITYETWFVGKSGATPGKIAARVRVVRADGSPVSFARAFGRYFAKLLSSCTLGIGFIVAAFDEEKRTLHDRICDTRVIRVG